MADDAREAPTEWHGPEAVPDLVRTMLEALAKAMGCHKGNWCLDLMFTDGHLHKWTRRSADA